MRLDLGSGPLPAPGFTGIDLGGGRNVIQRDVLEHLSELATGSVDEIRSRHFLEHAEDPVQVVAEIARVLRRGAAATIVVPHFSNPYFHSDPTHRHSFGIYWMSYLVHDTVLRRRVPHYQEPLPLDLLSVRLGFRGPVERPITHVARRALFSGLETKRWFVELYEASLSNRFSCYEITFVLRRHADA